MNKLYINQSKMVHKNNKWNISKDKGAELIHKNIIEIFAQNSGEKISLKDLIVLMNQKTNKINLECNKQKKPISTYIRSVYGNFTNFLEEYSMYGIMNFNKQIYIVIFENDIDPKYNYGRISDWELINTDDYVLV